MIGCGRIGLRKHIEAFAMNRQQVQLIGVCDVIEDRAKQSAYAYKEKTTIQPKVFADYRSLLAMDCDWVSIATESGNHSSISIEALKAGKHVLVEKPMALSVIEMDQMIQTAQEYGRNLGACFQNRFNPAVQELRKKVDQNAFGRIFHITARILWHRSKAYYDQALWRGTRRMDGGTLMNQCSHNIDLLQWMAGSSPSSVIGLTRNYAHPYLETEDFGAGLVAFHNGVIGIIEGTSNIYPSNLEETLSVFGEKGTVVLGGLAVNRIQTWRFEGEERHPFMNLPDPDTVYGNGHTPLFEDFCSSIRENRPPYIRGEEGKKAVEIILGIYEASENHKTGGTYESVG